MTKITENTLVPLSLVITFLGGIFWLTSIHNRAEATAREMDSQGVVIEKLRDDAVAIREALAEIRALQIESAGRLGRLSDFVERKLK